MSRRTATSASDALDTVYECPDCGEHSTERRCADCYLFTRRIGPGGPCPHWDEIVLLDDLNTQPERSITGTFTENLTGSVAGCGCSDARPPSCTRPLLTRCACRLLNSGTSPSSCSITRPA